MKRGEADHIARQPRIGTRQTDSLGRVWVKRHILARDEYASALIDATFDARLGSVADAHLYRLGYDLEASNYDHAADLLAATLDRLEVTDGE